MASLASSLQFLHLTPLPHAFSSSSSKACTTLTFPFSFSSLKLTTLSSRPVSSEFHHVEEEEEEEEAEGFNMFDSSEEEEGEEVSFSPDLKIFVGNLPFSADSSALADLFGRAGNVEMVEVIYDKVTGRSRGFGFVIMSSAKEVDAVVRQFNGYELDGRELRVNSGPPPPKKDGFGSRDFSSPRGGSRGSSTYGGGRGGRDYNSGGRDYSSGGGRDYNSGGGRDYNSGIRDYNSGGGRDYNSGSRDYNSGGGRDYNSGSRDFNSGSSGNRVYVGNLSWGVDDLALQNLFRGQGKVVEAKVVYDRESGRSRGFGFVTFNSAAEVNSAIESLDGADLDGRSIRVSPAEAKQRRQF